MSFSQILEGLGLIYQGTQTIILGFMDSLGIESAIANKLLILLAILLTLRYVSDNAKTILLFILVLLVAKLYLLQ